MAKKPAARRTPEQLKTTVWHDRDAALRDLKAAGLRERGEDYELGEYKPGSWMLLDRAAGEPASAPKPPPASPLTREDKVLGSLRKQPGRPPRGQPTVLIEAKAPKPAPKAKAKPAAKPEAKPKAEAKPEAKAPEAAPAPKANGEDHAAAETSLFKPLPKEGGPYELVIPEGAGPAFQKHTTHTAALELARKLRTPIQVRDKDGAIVRRYDWEEIRKTQVAAKKAQGTGSKRGGRQASGESRFARAFRLLTRPEGATARDLERECGWENVTQRFVNRASRLHGDAPITVLGDKHWRLEAKT